MTDSATSARHLTLSLVIATWFQPEWLRCLASWHTPSVTTHIVDHLGILEAYQLGYERTQSDLVAYLHDDLLCCDPDWLGKVQHEFADPTVAIVGFAGAPGYGAPEMYAPDRPYHHSSLGRVGFCSNLRDAEQHGARTTLAQDAAVLDGMALIVRRSFLDRIDGWEWRKPRHDHPSESPYDYYLYAEALCFHALRRERRIRLLPLAVDHLNARSTGMNPNLNLNFEGEHRRLYDEFRDVLPAREGGAE